MSQHASINSFVTSVYIYHSEAFQSFTKRTAPLGLERKDYEGKILYYFVSLFCELNQIQQILTKDGGKVRSWRCSPFGKWSRGGYWAHQNGGAGWDGQKDDGEGVPAGAGGPDGHAPRIRGYAGNVHCLSSSFQVLPYVTKPVSDDFNSRLTKP